MRGILAVSLKVRVAIQVLLGLVWAAEFPRPRWNKNADVCEPKFREQRARAPPKLPQASRVLQFDVGHITAIFTHLCSRNLFAEAASAGFLV